MIDYGMMEFITNITGDHGQVFLTSLATDRAASTHFTPVVDPNFRFWLQRMSHPLLKEWL
jgi:hypothetical protein